MSLHFDFFLYKIEEELIYIVDGENLLFQTSSQIRHQNITVIDSAINCVGKRDLDKGMNLGPVVMGGDSWTWFHEFESCHSILDG